MSNSRFIYFAGVDGCGKSSIIKELITEYEGNGFKAKSVWLRFNYFFTRPVLLICRIIGITRREKRGSKTISVHDFHKSKTIAVLVQYLHFLDTVLAFIVKAWIPLKFTDSVILCDKFVYDILADFMVETKDLNLLNTNIARLFLKLIPKDTPVVFFSVDKEEIIRRKPEVLIDDEDYDLKYKAYQVIMNSCEFKVIENYNYEETILKAKQILGI